MSEQVITSLTEGLPVEIGRIDRELKRLWQEGEGAATRASLINFAVYCEGADVMTQTTELIAQLTRDHACRAILIGLDRQKPGIGVQAWISAHCHLSRAGAKQICCEQITFLLERDARSLIPNIVFSHLDSDLPLALWWRGEFPEEPEEQLWTWVDRLIFDSSTWRDARHQFDLLRSTIEPAGPRMILCDLNWSRSLALRQAVAQLFDLPDSLPELQKITGVEITHGPGLRSAGLLLAGWLAAQLQWTHAGGEKATLFRNREKGEINVTFREEAGPPLGGIRLTAPDSSFVVARHADSPFLHADIHLPDAHDFHHLLPGGKVDLISLLNEELVAGGRHKVYLKAAAAVAHLL